VSEVFAEIRRRLQRMAVASDHRALASDASRRRVLELRAQALARPAEAASEEGPQVVRFAVGRDRYALPMGWVREVARAPIVTAVPGTSAWFRGVCHHRGEVLAVVDLHRLFTQDLAGASEQARLLVLGDTRAELAVLVDEVFDFVRVSARALRSLDGTPVGAADWILGMTPDGTIVLDGRALLTDPRLFAEPGDSRDHEGTRAT